MSDEELDNIEEIRRIVKMELINILCEYKELETCRKSIYDKYGNCIGSRPYTKDEIINELIDRLVR